MKKKYLQSLGNKAKTSVKKEAALFETASYC